MGIRRGQPLRLGQAASGWTPASLGGDLGFWVAQSSISQSGGFLSSWGDLGNTGAGDWAPSSGTVPISSLGSLKGVVLDGVANYLEGVDPLRCGIASSTGFTLFLVGQQVGNGGIVNNGFGNPGWMSLDDNSWTLTQQTTAMAVDSVQHQGFNGASRSVAQEINARSTPICIEVSLDGSSQLTCRVAGMDGTPVALSGGISLGATTLLGGRSPSGGFLSCILGECFISVNPLTGSDLTNARAYIASEWGIST